jgi:hypothetical protein
MNIDRTLSFPRNGRDSEVVSAGQDAAILASPTLCGAHVADRAVAAAVLIANAMGLSWSTLLARRVVFTVQRPAISWRLRRLNRVAEDSGK